MWEMLIEVHENFTVEELFNFMMIYIFNFDFAAHVM